MTKVSPLSRILASVFFSGRSDIGSTLLYFQEVWDSRSLLHIWAFKFQSKAVYSALLRKVGG